MPLPEVSVVVPTRDRAGLLTRTVSAALNQRDVALEVVVVDDGSTDSTQEALAALADPRLRLVGLASSQGVAEARNRGIAAAAGNWVAFLDDDDLWAPDKLRRQLDAARAAGNGWIYSGAVAVGEDLEIVAGGPPPAPAQVVAELPLRNVVPAGSSNVVVRRDMLQEAGTFDPALRHMADWDMWIRLAALGVPASVPGPLVAYLLHPGNASLDQAGILSEMAVIEQRYATHRDGAPVDRAYVYRWMAWSALRAGNRRAALRSYSRAVAAGDWRSIGRAGVAAVYPGIARNRYGRSRPDGHWCAPAEAWIEAQR